MIVEITSLDIHTAERVVDALESAGYTVEIAKHLGYEHDGLYRIGFTSLYERNRGKHKAKLRYACTKDEGAFIDGIVHGVRVTRQHYKGVG